MRVNLASYGTESVNSKPDRTRAAPDGRERPDKTVARDKIQFSFDTARLRSLGTRVLAQPEIRQQRVDLLRQLIGKGEYSVSDNQLADAIIADLTNGSAGPADWINCGSAHHKPARSGRAS